MPGPNLLYDVPEVGDPGPGWASDIHDGMRHIEAGAVVSLDAYVQAAGGAYDDVFDCSAAIAAAISAVPPGGVIRASTPGICRCSPTAWNTSRVFTLEGPGEGGEFSFWLHPTGDVASTGDGIVQFTPPGVSGSVRGKYGAGVRHVGIDMTGLTKAVGVRFDANAQHPRIHGLYTVGGYRGWQNHAAGGDFQHFDLNDMLDCGFFLDDSGLESKIRHGTVSRNADGTTDAYFKIILASGGDKGSIVMEDVNGGCPAVGSATVTRPFVVTAPVLTRLPFFGKDIVLDNCSDSAILTRIGYFRYRHGWLSAARGTTAAIQLNGCSYPYFGGTDFFGGSGGGTFHFVTAVTDGFCSEQNNCPSGPVYKNPSLATNIRVNDICPGASVRAQITDDVAALSANGGKLWGPRDFNDRVFLRQGPLTLAGAPLTGQTTLVAGLSPLISLPEVYAGVSDFILSHVNAAGAAGDLSIQTVTTGTGFRIQSSNSGDTSTVSWVHFYRA